MKLNSTKDIKCVVWDLDNTLWEGTLLESDKVVLKANIRDIILELDSRGILQSIASKNEFEIAMRTLKEFKLDSYFLYPQIHWNPKSKSIENIQKKLNIGIDTILFIDDQVFERDEVLANFENVNVLDAKYYMELLSHRQLNPRFITEDTKRRRFMYINEIKRDEEEKKFIGTKDEFLATLNMQFIISLARQEDLQRAQELTVRTNQLNATGRTYSYEELNEFINSDKHVLLICELNDKYGSYGKIGLALLEKTEMYWHIQLLLISCRVLSRSVGSVLLTYIMNKVKERGKKLLVTFKKTKTNKLMHATLDHLSFTEYCQDNTGNIILENKLSNIPEYPSYIDLIVPGDLDSLASPDDRGNKIEIFI